MPDSTAQTVEVVRNHEGGTRFTGMWGASWRVEAPTGKGPAVGTSKARHSRGGISWQADGNIPATKENPEGEGKIRREHALFYRTTRMPDFEKPRGPTQQCEKDVEDVAKAHELLRSRDNHRLR